MDERATAFCFWVRQLILLPKKRQPLQSSRLPPSQHQRNNKGLNFFTDVRKYKMNSMFDISQEPFYVLIVGNSRLVHELSKVIDSKAYIWTHKGQILKRTNGAVTFNRIIASSAIIEKKLSKHKHRYLYFFSTSHLQPSEKKIMNISILKDEYTLLHRHNFHP